MSKHDWVLASVAIILATAISLLLVRWLAPQLLGIPVDLQLVQTSKTLPPFFAGVFREEDAKAGGMLLNDPHTNTRFRPLLRQTAAPVRMMCLASATRGYRTRRILSSLVTARPTVSARHWRTTGRASYRQ